jgi:hypothetical protein
MVFPKPYWVFFGPNDGYMELLGNFGKPDALAEHMGMVLNRWHELRLHVDDE